MAIFLDYKGRLKLSTETYQFEYYIGMYILHSRQTVRSRDDITMPASEIG